METIAAADGHLLGVERFVPQGEHEAVVVIAAAMGVPQRYYRKFATWLAGQGFLVLSFDYRGIGASASNTPRNTAATLTDWVQFDCGAMLDAAAMAAGGRPLIWLGHSLGAQILPLVAHAERDVGQKHPVAERAVCMRSAGSCADRPPGPGRSPHRPLWLLQAAIRSHAVAPALAAGPQAQLTRLR